MSAPTIDWDLALIQKYNYSGPRYTSYPTALEFSDAFGEADFQQAVARYPERPLSLYVHIPFCHKLCYFCGCNKIVTRQQHKADQYLDVLEQEIIHRAPLFAGRHVSQLHWGGGTPTYLNKAQISRLMTLLRGNFSFNADAEISIEVDPREIELDVLDHLRAEGFNRLSMGVQDFNKEVQQAVNRVQDNDFIRALKSSIVFNLLDLAVGFPMPIILALILNELRFPRFKKVTQTILYLPHFLSWVIVGSVAYQMFRPTTGMVNVFLMNAGIIQNGIPFLTEKWHWAVTYLLIGVWQGMGWGTIIYLAAITAIDPSLYEAASIDGAGRWNKIKYVTLPGIKPTIMILLLMNVGNVLNAGFEIQYLLGNGLVQRVSQTIDIYVLKWGISQGDYAIGTAAGIFKSAVSIILIMIANQIAKRNGEERLF